MPASLLLPFRHHKYLLYQLTQREIKARYKQSVIGRAWVILNPLAQILVYSFVFSQVFRAPSGEIPYPVFLIAGLLPWSLFQGSIAIATNALVENAALIRKVAFPREVIVYAVIIAKLIDFAVASCIFLGFTLIFSVALAPTVLLIVLFLMMQILLTTGIALILAAANLFYRDVQYLTNLILMLWMYMTPIVYPLSLVPAPYAALYRLNPMVGIIEGYKASLFGGGIDLPLTLYSFAVAVVVFLLGYFMFKKGENVFADIA